MHSRASFTAFLFFLLVADWTLLLAAENEEAKPVYKEGTFVDTEKKGSYVDSINPSVMPVQEDRIVRKKTGGTRLMVDTGKFVDLEEQGGVQKSGGVLEVESDAEYFKRRLDKVEKDLKEIHSEIKDIQLQLRASVEKDGEAEGKEKSKPGVLSS